MFTTQELQTLQDALELAYQSNKRAQNTKKNPQFQEIYKQIELDITALQAKLKNIKPDKK